MVDIYTRGKEIIVVEEYNQTTLETIFNSSKYYKIHERLAKLYLFQILLAVRQLHLQMKVHRNINLSAIKITERGHIKLSNLEQVQTF